MTAGWTVVIPVRANGKSRLDVPDRVVLGRAMALDTIAAAAAVARVVVVTDDGGLVLGAVGIPNLRFVPETDPDLPAERGIDAAVARGASGISGPVAALLGDLPALRSDDLAAALDAATRAERGVVADAAGTGTTLVTAAAGMLRTAFGEGSFARHVALGCVPLEAAESLRSDVDTADDLAAAVALGVGARTARMLSVVPGGAAVR